MASNRCPLKIAQKKEDMGRLWGEFKDKSSEDPGTHLLWQRPLLCFSLSLWSQLASLPCFPYLLSFWGPASSTYKALSWKCTPSQPYCYVIAAVKHAPPCECTLCLWHQTCKKKNTICLWQIGFISSTAGGGRSGIQERQLYHMVRGPSLP